MLVPDPPSATRLNTEIARAVNSEEDPNYSVLCTVTNDVFTASTETDIIDKLLTMIPEISGLEIEIIDDRRIKDSGTQDKE